MDNILLYGYTDWIDQRFLDRAFPDDLCILAGGKHLRPSRKVRLIEKERLSDPEALQSVLETWELTMAVFFSESLSVFGETSFEDLRILTQLMDRLSHEHSTKLLVLTGLNREKADNYVRERLISAVRAEMYKDMGSDCAFIQTPWLYPADLSRGDSALVRWILEVGGEKTLMFPFPAQQEISFLCEDDLADLLSRIRDRWPQEDTTHIFTAGDRITCRQLGDVLEKLIPEIRSRYSDRHSAMALPLEDSALREIYGWFPKTHILTDLSAPNAAGGGGLVLKTAEDKGESPGRSFWKWGKLAAELAVGFVLMEGINRFARVQVQFQMIDFRLLFVVIIGLMYNIPAGLAAGVLSSLSLVLAYQRQGIGLLTLFYEPTNWFVFLIYFLVGAVCGYVRASDRDQITFTSQENDLLKEKYHFLRGLFLEAQQEKNEYRQQIISSQDSFGKIFKITQQLDVISPHLVFFQAMSVIEEIMQNQTVSIYSVGKNKNFARLEAASRNLDAPRSLSLDTYEEALEKLRETGLWVNQQVRSDKPMYLAGVSRDGEIVLLIMLWEAEFGQMSLYYSNLLKILCGLISTSLLRSLDFQNMTREKRYIPDTQILLTGAFREEMEIALSMNEAKIAHYTLHHLKSRQMTAPVMGEKLLGKIRENDVLGLVGEEVYLLVSQSTSEGIAILQERFGRQGIAISEADFEEVIRQAGQVSDEQGGGSGRGEAGGGGSA